MCWQTFSKCRTVSLYHLSIHGNLIAFVNLRSYLGIRLQIWIGINEIIDSSMKYYILKFNKSKPLSSSITLSACSHNGGFPRRSTIPLLISNSLDYSCRSRSSLIDLDCSDVKVLNLHWVKFNLSSMTGHNSLSETERWI